MYSYRNSVAVWPTVAKCCKSTKQNTTRICMFTRVSVQSGVCLVTHTREYPRLAVYAERMLLWCAACIPGGLPYKMISTGPMGTKSRSAKPEGTGMKSSSSQTGTITQPLMLTIKPTPEPRVVWHPSACHCEAFPFGQEVSRRPLPLPCNSPRVTPSVLLPAGWSDSAL
jgi:hypothetical protein